MFKRISIIIVFFVLMTTRADALLIVDTGEWNVENVGLAVSYTQWLAGKFETNQDYVINEIQGGMFIGDAGNLNLTIYGDGGDIPDISNEIFTKQFYLQNNGEIITEWVSFDNLNWALPASNYWVAFEVREGEAFFGGMPTDPPPANPLSDYALFGLAFSEDYRPNPHGPFSLRVFGEENTNAVPEPTTLFLLGGGLLGAMYNSRKRVKI